MSTNKLVKSAFIKKYFFILFSIIPISIIAGASVSLINILLIDLSFLILIFLKKEWKTLLKYEVKIILLICLYLIFNSLISIDKSLGYMRNFGFIRILVFFCAANYFFSKYENFSKILLVWSVIIIFIMTDIYFEAYTGKNYLGYGEGDRIFSFFKDRAVVGGYLNSFYLMLIGYLLFNNKSKSANKDNLVFFLFFALLIAIIITGERANAIKGILGFLFFFIFVNRYSFKKKVYLVFLIIFSALFIFFQSEFLQLRYKHQLLNTINSKEKIEKTYNNNVYIALQKSGVEVFKDNYLFGVGNKNYRQATCQTEEERTTTSGDRKSVNKYYVCGFHPHQTYVELLAEHGLFGTLILLILIFALIARALKKIIKSGNQIQLGCLAYIFVVFVPILPSGAFFGDYLVTIFWINISIMLSVNKDTNIFSR